MRTTTQYGTDFLKNDLNETTKSKKNDFRERLNNYEYGHDENLKSIMQEGRNKTQEGIRER